MFDNVTLRKDRAVHQTIEISEVKLEVCSVCQNDCAECAHGELRLQTKKYQLSMEQVRDFIKFTEESNYLIHQLSIHGGGEPLLWKNFNEALPLFGKSTAIKSIVVTTNGLAIKRIDNEAWQHIDTLNISFYDDQPNALLEDTTVAKYGHKIHVEHIPYFFSRIKNNSEVFKIPSKCMCSGPMILENNVFPFCDPPVFDAAQIMGIDIWKLNGIYKKIEQNYLSEFDPSLRGNMEICRYCWANSNYIKEKRIVPQSITGGCWQ